MRKQEYSTPQPPSSPSLSSQELSFPSFHNLCLDERSYEFLQPQPIEQFEFSQNSCPKTKGIQKDMMNKKWGIKERGGKSKESNKKKIQKLEKIIGQLQTENDRLRRKIQCCLTCSRTNLDENNFIQMLRPNYQEQMRKIAGHIDSPRHSKGSHGSLEFQNIEFHAPYMGKQTDDKAWVFLGTVMIAMGSKCLEVDGTINVFKILKQSVDSLRRQVQKSSPNISMDFFLSKEEMNEAPYISQIGYDPFSQKHQEQGLSLQGIKVESVEQFQLTYDSKLSFNLKYEALLGAMEYIREHSWVIG